jgi:hypothetical protein
VSFELHVDDGADDLGDVSGLVCWCGHKTLSFEFCLEVRQSIARMATVPRRRR